MMIGSGHQHGPRWGTRGGSMEICKPYSLFRELAGEISIFSFGKGVNASAVGYVALVA